MDATPPTGELIGLNGRQKGKHYPLDKPLTKIGKDESCDLRLIADGVQPVHALLVRHGDSALLAAWDGGEVFLDGKPVEQEPLRDKAILRFGPFQFQLRLPTEPRNTLRIRPEESDEDAPPPLPSGSGADSLEERRKQLEALQRQLRDSRARFREETKRKETEIEQQFRDLSEAFDEADRREQRAEQERERLMNLRARFIKRWKRHWATERKSIERQTETLHHDLAKLVSRSTAFEAERKEALSRIEAETQAIHEDRHRREVEHAAWEVMRDEERRRLDLARMEIDEKTKRLERTDNRLRTEHQRLDKKIRSLKQEADGLETRVKNLRKTLSEQESRKPKQMEKVNEEPSILKLSDALPPGAIYVKSPLAGEELSQEKRRERLESFARSLSDQQAVLAEQLDRMSVAKEFWRAEEKRVVEELEALTREMQTQDDELIRRDEELVRREEQLIREQQEVRERKLEIDTAHARLTLERSQFHGERDRKRAEINQSLRHADRVQRTYENLCHRWLTTRAEEEEQRQNSQKKLLELRERWLGVVAEEQSIRRRLEDRERSLAQREMALEQTRQSLAEKADGALFEKRLERNRRQVMSVFRRAEEKLTRHREAIESEAESMRELFAVSTERLRVANYREEAVRKEAIELERGRVEADLKREAEAEAEERRKQEAQAFENEIHELRSELARLLPAEVAEEKRAA